MRRVICKPFVISTTGRFISHLEGGNIMSMEDLVIAEMNDNPDLDAERERAMREGEEGDPEQAHI